MVRKNFCKKRIYNLILALVLMAEFFLLSFNTCFAKNKKAEDMKTVTTVINDCFDAISDDGTNVLSGSILATAGSTGGDWFAIGCGQYKKVDAYTDYLALLEKYVTECYRENSYGLSRNKATEWHRISLAVLACGADPCAFGKKPDGSHINLIADGTYNCMIGNPWKQGINGAAYALICLDAMKYNIPEGALYTRDDFIEYILEKELEGGGFALRGGAVDVDITSMVLTALAPYYDANRNVKAAVDRGLDALSMMQSDNGDFAYGGGSTAESTAQALVALTSLGIDIWSDKRFVTDSGKTVFDGLLEFYDSKKKGFAHIKGESISAMADAQCIYALVSLYRQVNGMGRLYDFTDYADNKSEAIKTPSTNTDTKHTDRPVQTAAPDTDSKDNKTQVSTYIKSDEAGSIETKKTANRLKAVETPKAEDAAKDASKKKDNKKTGKTKEYEDTEEDIVQTDAAQDNIQDSLQDNIQDSIQYSIQDDIRDNVQDDLPDATAEHVNSGDVKGQITDKKYTKEIAGAAGMLTAICIIVITYIIKRRRI